MRRVEFLMDGRYLPEFMRDFHTQKDIFKSVNELVERAKNRDKERICAAPNYPNWIDAHIYVIDIFLWYMAKHGYTLQKSRVKVEDFADISETLEDYRKREDDAFHTELEKVLSKESR